MSAPSAADRLAPTGAPCTCGHPFGTGACLDEHARRLAAMTPLGPTVHLHEWGPEVRGLSYCRDVTCDATRRREDEW